VDRSGYARMPAFVQKQSVTDALCQNGQSHQVSIAVQQHPITLGVFWGGFQRNLTGYYLDNIMIGKGLADMGSIPAAFFISVLQD